MTSLIDETDKVLVIERYLDRHERWKYSSVYRLTIWNPYIAGVCDVIACSYYVGTGLILASCCLSINSAFYNRLTGAWFKFNTDVLRARLVTSLGQADIFMKRLCVVHVHNCKKQKDWVWLYGVVCVKFSKDKDTDTEILDSCVWHDATSDVVVKLKKRVNSTMSQCLYVHKCIFINPIKLSREENLMSAFTLNKLILKHASWLSQNCFNALKLWNATIRPYINLNTRP